jgi:hypothetical protein
MSEVASPANRAKAVHDSLEQAQAASQEGDSIARALKATHTNDEAGAALAWSWH